MKSLSKIFLFCSLLILFSCDDVIDPLDGALVEVSYNASTTPIQVQLYDARTQEILGTSESVDIEITVEGESANQITNTWGFQESTYESNLGFFSLAVDPNLSSPSANNPLRISIQAKATGYLDSGKSYLINSEGAQFIVINMVQKNNPPQGVEYISEDVSSALNEQGSLSSEIEISVPNEKAKISLPQNLVILDEMGSPLSGDISIELTYFDNMENEALLAYPGGLLTQINTGSGTEDGLFYSAGFAAIEISDQNGNEASTFQNGSVELEMQINSETYNPETNSAVSMNDQVGLYSYEPETGEWTFENNLTVTDGPGGMMASANLEHLSFYNLDWWWGETCSSSDGALVYFYDIFSDCEEVDSIGVYLEYYITQVGGNASIIGSGAHYFQEDVLYTFGSWTSPSTAIAIDWISPDEGCQVGGNQVTIPPAFDPLLIQDACDPQSYGAQLDVTGCGDAISVDLNLECLENNYDISTEVGFYIRETNCSSWEYFETENSQITIPGNLSETYDVWFDGETYTGLTVPDTLAEIDVEVVLPSDICSLFE